MDTPLLGLWVSDAPRVALEPGFLLEAKEIGFTTLAVMVDSSEAPWDPRWTPWQLERFTQRAIDLDMEVVLTTWPCPRRAILDAMGRDMAELLRVGGAGWESDVEGLWSLRMLRGFSDLEEASRYYLDMQRRICEPLDVRIELTTHPWHDEGYWTTDELERWLRLDEEARQGELGPNVDRLVWQAYSTTRTPSGATVRWNSRFGPGRTQIFTLDRARSVPGVAEGRPRLCVGLAGYRQRWEAPHTPYEGMRIAYETALTYSPFEVRYWDSLQIIGAQRNPYAAAAIRRIRNS